MRTSAIDLALGQILTKKRLGRYLEHTGGNLSEALSLYERNTRLSESFYSPLQCLEVCFRNKLDQALAARYGVEWMKDKSCPLNPDATTEALAGPPRIWPISANATRVR